uniref:Uncharacterized protein n=1 Tax=Panagrolaimus sp. ES5 TaxID=591445 RepID=A0AC34G5V0_9BILA
MPKLNKSQNIPTVETDTVTKELIENLNIYIAQNNLDNMSNVEKYDEIEQLRKQLQQRNKNFDGFEISAINYASAIAGGAKAVVDQKRITRNISTKISKETGYSKDSLLYSGIPYGKREKFAAKNISKKRSEEIAEFNEDFQKQLNVKHILLKKYSEKSGILEENRPQRNRRNGKAAAATVKFITKTPENKFQIDPLNFDVIQEKYYDLLVENMDQKVTKAIPFNIDDNFY